MPYPPETARPEMPLRNHNFFTLAAIGFLAYYIVGMWHEVLGHGLALYLYGARHFVLTSTSMGSTDGMSSSSASASRVVEAAGSLSTILLGIALYPLVYRTFRDRAKPVLRLFLWLVAAVGIFHGFSYIAFSGVANVGDWKAVISDWPHQGLLRTLEIVFGVAICAWEVRFFARFFGKFSESLTRLALVPYFSGTIGFCLAGLRLPNAAHYFVISVIPASLIGQGILVFVAPVARRSSSGTSEKDRIPFCAPALVLAVIVLGVLFLTAPGVRFTLP
jgi:hypothetical protein